MVRLLAHTKNYHASHYVDIARFAVGSLCISYQVYFPCQTNGCSIPSCYLASRNAHAPMHCTGASRISRCISVVWEWNLWTETWNRTAMKEILGNKTKSDVRVKNSACCLKTRFEQPPMQTRDLENVPWNRASNNFGKMQYILVRSQTNNWAGLDIGM